MNNIFTTPADLNDDAIRNHGAQVCHLLGNLEPGCLVRIGPTAYSDRDGHLLAQQDRIVDVWRAIDPAFETRYYTDCDPDEVYICTDADAFGGPVGRCESGEPLILETIWTGGDYPIDAETGMELRFDD